MKSYQQIAGDGTIDRATPAPASPTHTPEPWNVERPFQDPGVYIAGPNTGLIAKLYVPEAMLYNGDKQVSIDGNAARIVACVNACAGMTNPATEIKALRDALKMAIEWSKEVPDPYREFPFIAAARAALGVQP